MLRMSQFGKDSLTKVNLHVATYSSLDESEHTGKIQSLSQEKILPLDPKAKKNLKKKKPNNFFKELF